MFLNSLYTLCRRILMGDQQLPQQLDTLFDQHTNQALHVKDWAQALCESDNDLIHDDCSVTSIVFYKFPMNPYHEYLQFTVTLKKNNKERKVIFETHRYAGNDGTTIPPAVARSLEASPPPGGSVSHAAVASVVEYPARDLVRKLVHVSGQAECEKDPTKCERNMRKQKKTCTHSRVQHKQDFAFGKLPLIPFAILLKSVSSYQEYRLLATQCYWYSYTVFLLAFSYTLNGGVSPETQLPKEILDAAKKVAEADSMTFPKTGRYSFVPVPKHGNHVAVWKIFEDAMNEYKRSNTRGRLMQSEADKAALRADQETLRADQAALRADMAAMQTRHEADKAQYLARIDELERQLLEQRGNNAPGEVNE